MKICSLYWLVSYKGRQSLICALLNMFLYFCMCLQDASPQSGLLQSSIITLYTMYITWSAMTNNPSKLHIKKNLRKYLLSVFGLSFHFMSFHFVPTQIDAIFGEFCGAIQTRCSTFIVSWCLLLNKAKLPARIQIINVTHYYPHILLWSIKYTY